MSILKKIEIKGLWGTTDIEWELDPHVNILGGYNGSGKSSILNIIGGLIYDDKNMHEYNPFFNELCLIKEAGTFYMKAFTSNFSELEGQLQNNVFGDASKILEKVRQEYLGNKMPFHIPISLTLATYQQNNGSRSAITTEEVKKHFDSEFISPIDKVLKDELKEVQRRYISYRLSLGLELQQLFDTSSIEEIKEYQEKRFRYQKRFEEIINELFSKTGKKLMYNKDNTIFFSKDSTRIELDKLSSGEIQILIILLSMVLQDGKPTVVLMDEPDLTLHIDWQKKLISYMVELNPNAQLIIATHSPGLIMENWINNVVEVSEISTFIK
ncbi:MAG: ATP-binding protein [Cytophagales bacterium]|nr:ATP-binding protein [Cytophagales bacterium]